MKHGSLVAIILSTLFILCFVSNVIAQSQPSLEETTKWLKTTLEDKGKVSMDGKSWVVKDVLFDGCNFQYKFDFIDIDDTVKTTFYKLNLKDINPDVGASSDNYTPFYSTDLEATNGEKKIYVRWYNGKSEQVNFSGGLDFRDEYTAKRVATAFSHAIVLCGGKKDLF